MIWLALALAQDRSSPPEVRPAAPFAHPAAEAVSVEMGWDREAIDRSVKNFETFSGNLNTTLEDVRGVVTAVDRDAIDRSVKAIDTFTARLNKAADGVDKILATAQTAADDVGKMTESLAGRREDLDRIVTNFSEMAERLNTASVRVSEILDKANGVVDGFEKDGLFVEINEAARAIRDVAQKFDGRANEIANGLARFSGRGLRDLEVLVGEARNAVSRVERVVRNLERNPSEFIFGKSSVREYNSRRR